MAKKLYVVWKGRKTGIFKSWDECAAQVNGFPGAEYKAFSTWSEAEKAFHHAYSEYVTGKAPHRLKQFDKTKQLSEDKLRRIGNPIAESYSVDAACSGNPGVLEYRCVHNHTGQEIFRQGPYPHGTNNIGEFLAIVHALALFKRKKITAPIYSDSEIAMGWVESRKCRTKLEQIQVNAELFSLIERAEKWLLENDYENCVLKWWTPVWGEIPADFGRKQH
jgi:ribonuclease HI